MPHELPPITAIVGPVTGPKPPGKLHKMWMVLGWDQYCEQWHNTTRMLYMRRDSAEKNAKILANEYTHYRIVEIPGDE